MASACLPTRAGSGHTLVVTLSSSRGSPGAWPSGGHVPGAICHRHARMSPRNRERRAEQTREGMHDVCLAHAGYVRIPGIYHHLQHEGTLLTLFSNEEACNVSSGKE